MALSDPPPRDWNELTAQEQLALREAYGHYLDGLPATCDLTEKNERFRPGSPSEESPTGPWAGETFCHAPRSTEYGA
jgi:hypothetical protein